MTAALPHVRRIAIKLEYDGTDHLGWQLQNRGRTVQGVVEEAVRRATGSPERIPVQGAARTDAGVHAEGQVAHFDTVSRLGPERMVRALNFWLPDDVSVLAARLAPADFHARFCAEAKLYRYRVMTCRQPRPLTERYCWRVPVALDLAALRACARQLIGTRDFTSFTCAGGATRSAVRTVWRSEWLRAGEELQFFIKADGFTYKMVRALVGTMIEAGKGKLSPAQFGEALRACDRREAGPTAPPHGLALVKVCYPPASDPFRAPAP